MNNEEYWSKKRGRLSTVEYKNIHILLTDWKQQNGITERCSVHHRDDTEETRKYNSEHYERWGFNEDGSFEYGKYVIFMTQAEHMRYHRKGEKCSAEHRAAISAATKGKNNPMYGKHHSDETRAKLSAARQSEKALYTTYKDNGGKLHWNAFRTALSNGTITLADDMERD